MQPMTISRLARVAGVNVETIRFYEKQGLLPAPPREANGSRRYREEDLERLRFIRQAKDLGFSLSDIHELVQLSQAEDGAAAMPRDAALLRIERKMAALEQIRAALQRQPPADRRRP